MSTPRLSLNPPPRLLMGPGPSPVDQRVYAALSLPVVGHLDPYLFEVFGQTQTLLRKVFGTENAYTMAVSGTGTSGMEASVWSLVEPGTKVAVLVNGFFCGRIAEMARRQGAEVVCLEKPWGEVFNDAEVEEFIFREKPRVVAFVQGETSTGVLQSGKAISVAAHEVGALVIGDCVTSLGNLPVNVDDTGIDIAYSCSQKGLGCVPGLSPITVSPRAVAHLQGRSSPNPSFYLDLGLLYDYWVGRRYHHTASASLFYGLREALALIEEEGLENRFRRIEQNHQAFVAGAEAMGLQMHVAPGHRLWPLNAVRVPGGVSDAAVREHMLDDDGIEILGGFGLLAGRVFRIGIMGAGSTRENVLRVLDSLEAALAKEGFKPTDHGRDAAEAFYTGK
jgi:alanine-glyoxylate transaminase/serine-glyoxylate transaminase/serine-pyruvate transaminase